MIWRSGMGVVDDQEAFTFCFMPFRTVGVFSACACIPFQSFGWWSWAQYFSLLIFCALHSISKCYLTYDKTNERIFLLFWRSYLILEDIMISEVWLYSLLFFPSWNINWKISSLSKMLFYIEAIISLPVFDNPHSLTWCR